MPNKSPVERPFAVRIGPVYLMVEPVEVMRKDGAWHDRADYFLLTVDPDPSVSESDLLSCLVDCYRHLGLLTKDWPLDCGLVMVEVPSYPTLVASLSSLLTRRYETTAVYCPRESQFVVCVGFMSECAPEYRVWRNGDTIHKTHFRPKVQEKPNA